jgi:hypothetical protein
MQTKTAPLFPTLALALIAGMGQAQTVEESEFKYLAELAEAGFEPFALSSSASASFGMKQGAEMYLCFLADTGELVAQRQAVIGAALQAADAPRRLPNFLVTCIQAQ